MITFFCFLAFGLFVVIMLIVKTVEDDAEDRIEQIRENERKKREAEANSFATKVRNFFAQVGVIACIVLLLMLFFG